MKTLNLPEKEYEQQVKNVYEKECLCIGLSNAAAIKYEQPFIKNLTSVTICPGPNIVYFSKKVSLKEMTDHIYGRTDIIAVSNRPHVFINELTIYINYLHEQLIKEPVTSEDKKRNKYYNSFYEELKNGIKYYRDMVNSSDPKLEDIGEKFEDELNEAESQLEQLFESRIRQNESVPYSPFISSNSIS